MRNYTVGGNVFRRIIIILDDKHMKEINMRYLGTSWTEKVPIIYTTERFMALSEELKRPGIFHEVGHIHFEHFFSNNYIGQ